MKQKTSNYTNYLYEPFFHQSDSIKTSSSQPIIITKHLDWDTEFFGFKCARIEEIIFTKIDNKFNKKLADVVSSLTKNNYRLIDIRVPYPQIDLIRSLEKLGFRFIEVLNIYHLKSSLIDVKSFQKSPYKTIETTKISPNDLKKNGYKNFNLNLLFNKSRFFRDSNFDQKKAQSFHQHLLHSLIFKQNTFILGTFDNDNLAGFLVAQINKLKSKKISLLWQIVVSPQYHQKGIGSRLLKEFLKYSKQHSDYIEIGTQVDNLPANKLYSKYKLNISTQLVTMHKWID